MAPTDTEAAAALHWVKLRSMPVFWPACVYTSYSDAVEYTHDVWPLRSDKPVLDAEDRVLYFFGVGPRACHVVASGSAPNLQLCVAHEDDLTLEKWTSAEEFPLLCGKYQVPEDLAKRAENNSCFLRACEEAETYVKDVQTKEQASELFVTLLTMAKKAHTTGKAVVVREIIPSPAKTQKKTAKKTSQQIEQEKAIEVARMLKTPEMGTMVAKCWQQMLEAGWETMAQGDGQVLYKMPGTTFFNLVPNINLFDSLEKACGRYLSEWVKSVAVDDSSDDFSDLTEFLWPMAAGSGWEGLATASEILYKKKDLPFDQWVPNVTIFRSKTQAVAKYLEECGLISSNNDSTPEEEDAQDNVSDIAASDVDMEEVEQSEDQCQIYEVECDGGEESEDGESEVEEGNQEEEPPAAPVKAAAKPKRSTKKHQQQQKKKQRRYLENMPSFKMSFGKLEAELMRRGWYYRNGPLHFLYYQPYCKTMNSKTLKANKDYFRGQEELESFARTCGLYDEVEAKLRAELYDLCTLESEEDSENDEETQVAPPTKVPANTQAPASKRAPASKPVSKASKVVLNASKPLPSIQQTKAPARRERSHARSGSRNTQSKPAPRSRVGLSTSTTLAEVKFGEIWRVLADDGWHYRYSSLECDYFKPHCDTAKDGIAGKDYFQSKDLLIEYLQTSGIWDATAARVRAEAAMDSSDEDMIDSDTETATPVQKRKRNDSTPAPQPSSKKYKDTFRTPTLKRLATADLSDDDEDMDTISPDAAGTKGKENNGSGRQPLRNLANSFTPSPNTTRKEKEEKKGPQHSANDDVAVDPAKSSPRNLIQSAIQKLTSAYIPTNFRHREKEFREIREFFSDCFDGKEEKTSLYISGAPGCGKSALLKATQSEIDTLYQVSLCCLR
ncbi:hypothetical protein P3T76_007345 [Phytophthora citrophthora]|uniref:Uncharacterized protein n=1 Tax=Phytophthora citrophthora TaxID=4793 RepID=A0AAD9GN55_9STRA|nr:hypothetical protein P3T76_007345 [Phytophthora citrophthora]